MVWGSGTRIRDTSYFEAKCSWTESLGLRVWVLGLRVWVLGFRV